MRKCILNVMCLSLLPLASGASGKDSGGSGEGCRRVKHVLLLSVDGMHALDLANYVRLNPSSTMAALRASGINYTNASTTQPSDSLPSMVGIVTGGSPAVTGIYYDDAWHRQLSPPGSNCAVVGAKIDLKETIDINPAAVDAGGGLDPAKLPLNPANGCQPVYPHELLRVNTIFEVIRAAGLHTAYSEKRPSYDILNGPSGAGVADLFVPEISGYGAVTDTPKMQAFDDLRVQSILAEIGGRDHSGQNPAPAPAIFGMNFQAVNSAKKFTGGYTDHAGGFDPTLKAVLDHIDDALGQMVAALKANRLYESTAIILMAKHGETPLDPPRTIVGTTVIPGIINGVKSGLAAKTPTQKANSFIWLKDQTYTAAVVEALEANRAAIGAGRILHGESLKLLFPDPLTDPVVPDIIVVTNSGVNFEPAGSTTMAEHGGFGENDTHVPLLVAIPGLAARTVQAPVQTTQIAPTVLELLHLNPQALDAVRLEGTPVLPGFDKKGGPED
jgi:hypothetical protein